MPARDGTGPLGYGPMTGRGLGPCGRGLGTGLGRGFGRGFRRFGHVPAPTPTKEQETADLKAEKQAIQEELKAIEERLKELEKK